MGIYFRLVDYKSQNEKETAFIESLKINKDRYIVDKSNFSKIPDSPIAYWLSENFIKIFTNKKLSDIADARQGLATGDNDKFLRQWFEIELHKCNFNSKNLQDAHNSGQKYFPYNKGGTYRKWYGNNDYVIAFDKNNYDVLSKQGNHLPSKDFYFKEGGVWSALSNACFSMRYCPTGYVFDTKGSKLFSDILMYLLGLLNTKIAQQILNVLSPTIDYSVGAVQKIPVVILENAIIECYTNKCITISRHDWDKNETSWDFKKCPLV